MLRKPKSFGGGQKLRAKRGAANHRCLTNSVRASVTGFVKGGQADDATRTHFRMRRNGVLYSFRGGLLPASFADQ